MLFELPDNVQILFNEVDAALDSHARGCGFFTPRRTERERREAIALLVSEQIRDAVADGILPVQDGDFPSAASVQAPRGARMARRSARGYASRSTTAA